MTSVPEKPRQKWWSLRGPEGVRLGWAMLLFLAILALLEAIMYVGIAYVFHLKQVPADGIGLALGLSAEVTQTLPVVVALILVARIERRSVTAYNLSTDHAVRLFALGVAGGLTALSALMELLVATGHMSVEGPVLTALPAVGFGIGWAAAFILAGVGEELVWRGYLQASLTRKFGFWRAAVLTSIIFAAAHVHNPGENPLGVVQVFVAGLVFCALLRMSGSLWLGIGFHAAWDWTQSYLFGTANSGLLMKGHLFESHPLGSPLGSGGAAGPEGSIFATFVFIGALVPLHFLVRRLAPAVGRAATGGHTGVSTHSH